MCYTRHGLKKHTSFAHLLQAIEVDENSIIELAIEEGWITRPPKKITIVELLAAIYECIEKGTASYNDIASTIDKNSDADGPSKQAVAKPINEKSQKVFQWLLQKAFEQKLASSPLDGSSAEFLHSYQRVLVQDSTVIQLPSWLYEDFSGVSNGSSKVCNCRIQATYDILNKLFINFSIDPYSKNDLLAAPELELQPGDLVLRDRGYLTKSEIQRHQDNEADFIYRHKSGSHYLDPLTEEPIDLLKFLSKNGSMDQTVLINNEESTPLTQ